MKVIEDILGEVDNWVYLGFAFLIALFMNDNWASQGLIAACLIKVKAQ